MDTIKIASGPVRMIAHRGVSGLERENTCPAFVAAGNRSYYGVETDVHKTADGQFVIIHDENTNRITLETVNVNVEQNPYSAVENIVLPDLDGSTNRQDIRLPLLVDYIKICKKYEKVCILEIKGTMTKEDLSAIVTQIQELEYLTQVIFISFSLDNCIILRELVPDNAIQWLTCDAKPETVEKLLQYRLDLDVYYSALTKEIVDDLHAKNILVNCWTVDNKEIAEELVAMGVDFITSNILE